MAKSKKESESTDVCGITTSWGRGPSLNPDKCVVGEDDGCIIF